jgi:predicted transglutaminase-like cysteine proteinase
MGLFEHARVWRAVVLACGLAAMGTAADLHAAPLEIAGTPPAAPAAEPFGLSASPVLWGSVLGKWQGVERKLADERVQIALCDGDRANCASDAALKFLAVVDSGRAREGRARLGEINRAINLSIRPMSDLAQYGQIDFWASPLITFYRGAGDCEDYAIAKYMALREAGIAGQDLRIVIMHDRLSGDDHAVTAARLDGHWLMLDNRRMAMVEDIHERNYRPLFVIDDQGVRKYSDMPLLASTAKHDAERTAALTLAAAPSLIAPLN